MEQQLERKGPDRKEYQRLEEENASIKELLDICEEQRSIFRERAAKYYEEKRYWGHARNSEHKKLVQCREELERAQRQKPDPLARAKDQEIERLHVHLDTALRC